MGAYNDVKLDPPLSCPTCGSELSSWQTKAISYAGYDLANTFQRLRINSRVSGEIHTSCKRCQTYVSRMVTKGQVHEAPPPTSQEFNRAVTKRKDVPAILKKLGK